MEIWRLITVAITFSSLVIPEIFANNGSTVPRDDDCAEENCSPNGPIVRFPFRLKGKQPENCGYNAGYELNCDHMNRTVLEISSPSMKFLVKNISYKSQMIQVNLAEGCQLKRLRDLDISAIQFQFSSPAYMVDRYTLFNCSLVNNNTRYSSYWYRRISCLDTPGYEVLATASNNEIQSLSVDLCTKMYDTNLVSAEIFEMKNMLNLTWSLPRCKSCEVHEGGICRRKNGTNNQIDCYGGKTYKFGMHVS
ncbi:hypothetical protein ACH5RR_007124 [Cinchona calisaya]|uniref:RING-type E3 ubiquitin transferase n=1 Tax=Cinchona calisaya TaxID=153742 RepID=A0ABD3AQX0_9GENT